MSRSDVPDFWPGKRVQPSPEFRRQFPSCDDIKEGRVVGAYGSDYGCQVLVEWDNRRQAVRLNEKFLKDEE